jgi:rhamnose transport system permease protein
LNAYRSRLSPQVLVMAAFRLREAGVAVALGAVLVVFALRAPDFLSIGNWQDIATNIALVVVLCVGQTMVILTRNIDLSVGSVVALSAFLCVETLSNHDEIPLVAVALGALALGALCGLGNGLLVAKARIPAIIATLATMTILRGAVYQVSGGETVQVYGLQSLAALGATDIFGVPLLAFIALVVAVSGAAVLNWAHRGRDFYAVGSNPEAAHYAGIPVASRIILAFVISGTLAGLGGFMFAVRFAAVNPTSASGLELAVVAAAVIGGVNVFGGSGTILGAVLGATFVGTVDNGFTLLKISEFWTIAFQGFAIIFAITVDALITRRLQQALRRRRRRVVVPSSGASS